MDATFDLCVTILLVLADFLGVTYEAINVWIFVILWPAFTVFLIAFAVHQRRLIRRLKGEPAPPASRPDHARQGA